MLGRTGTKVLRVRYEDLARSVGPTLRVMARFAGLPADHLCLEFLGGDEDSPWAELHQAHTASGNPMRFATGKIPIRADQRWRTGMPRSQRRMVTALTLPLLVRYGYVRQAA